MKKKYPKSFYKNIKILKLRLVLEYRERGKKRENKEERKKKGKASE